MQWPGRRCAAPWPPDKAAWTPSSFAVQPCSCPARHDCRAGTASATSWSAQLRAPVRSTCRRATPVAWAAAAAAAGASGAGTPGTQWTCSPPGTGYLAQWWPPWPQRLRWPPASQRPGSACPAGAPPCRPARPAGRAPAAARRLRAAPSAAGTAPGFRRCTLREIRRLARCRVHGGTEHLCGCSSRMPATSDAGCSAARQPAHVLAPASDAGCSEVTQPRSGSAGRLVQFTSAREGWRLEMDSPAALHCPPAVGR